MGNDFAPHSLLTEEVETANEDATGLVDLSEDESEVEPISFFRPELIERAFKALSADALRGGSQLHRGDIDRTYLRKNLSISECMEVEGRIVAAGYRIIEDDVELEDVEVAEQRRAHKYLTEVEERELGRKIQLAKRLPEDRAKLGRAYVERVQREAQRAKETFVVTNLRYANQIARRMGQHRHLTEEDLAQEGLIGLLKAVEMYDPERGFRFKTYATWWIEQKMRRAIADGDRLIRLPVHVHESVMRIRRARARWALVRGRSPTQDELATAIGMNPERLAKLVWRVLATECTEGDEPIRDDATLLSQVADNSPSQLDIVLSAELKERCQDLLGTLSPQEEDIIRKRFGIGVDQEYTLASLGVQYGVTRERIRQIEARALKKLRHPSRSWILDGFMES